MLASLLRPKKRRVYAERSPFSSPYTTREPVWSLLRRNADARYETIPDRDRAGPDLEQTDYDEDIEDEEDADGEDEEDGPEATPLLPIFSASHLGMELNDLPCVSLSGHVD